MPNFDFLFSSYQLNALASPPWTAYTCAKPPSTNNSVPVMLAAVVRCEEHHGPDDLIGCTQPAERDRARDRLPALQSSFRRSQQVIQSGCVSGAGAHCVDADAALLQVRCPCPRERSHSGLGSGINTVRRQPFASVNGRIQDDRGAIRQQRQRFCTVNSRPFTLTLKMDS